LHWVPDLSVFVGLNWRVLVFDDFYLMIHFSIHCHE
jgi:hypothetical protein